MKIVVIGGGFGGVWSAMAAARHAKLLEKEVEIVVINKDNYHSIRPRFYEEDLSQTRVPFSQFLIPLGIKTLIGSVTKIQLNYKKIGLANGENVSYDRLILAAGSQLHAPSIPGLTEYGYNLDTFEAAKKLAAHLETLPSKSTPERSTILVIGGSFTGLEIATELVRRLKNIFTQQEKTRIIIVDRHEIGSSLGSNIQPYITRALQELNIETLSNQQVKSISANHVCLASGEMIDTQTVICTTGMRANPLTVQFPVERDQQGRLQVDPNLRILGVKDCFAAGDVCAAMTDETHISLMSCQHAMPQGRIAGHNAVADLYDKPLIAYQQPRYVTCLDLGPWGALYSEGWDRSVVSEKDVAKKVKNYINHERIYPPLTENSDDLLKAADPTFKPLRAKLTIPILSV